jgi:hypothetical protein
VERTARKPSVLVRFAGGREAGTERRGHAVLVLGGQRTLFAQSPSDQRPAASVTPDPWPKIVRNGCDVSAHAAVSGSVLAAGAKGPDFGVIEITAKTHV